MNYDTIRQTIHQLIRAIDEGRIQPRGARRARRPLGSALLAASVGLTAAGCGCGANQTTTPTDPAVQPSQPTDPGAVAEYGVVDPDPEPGDPAAVDPGPVEEYAVVAPPDDDPGAAAEYMAPDPDGE